MKDKKTQSNKILELCTMLPDACDSFLMETATERSNTTRLAYAHDLNVFFDYLISYHPHFADKEKKSITIDDIKFIQPTDISRYLTIYGQTHREKTTARKRACLSSFFSHLCNNRLLEYNPVSAAARVKIPKTDSVTYLNMEEQEKLLQTVNYGSGLDDKKMKYHGRYQKRDLALIMLLLDTGMRVSELHGIDLKDLDLDNCSVIVTRKGGNVATLYYSDEVRNLLQDYIDERKSKFPHIGAEEPLFVTLQGNRLAVRSIETLVKKYAVTALPGKGYLISPHKMRSSFAMELYGETRDILLLQKKLGHTNITATNIYAKASNKDMEDSRNILQQKRQNRE